MVYKIFTFQNSPWCVLSSQSVCPVGQNGKLLTVLVIIKVNNFIFEPHIITHFFFFTGLVNCPKSCNTRSHCVIYYSICRDVKYCNLGKLEAWLWDSGYSCHSMPHLECLQLWDAAWRPSSDREEGSRTVTRPHPPKGYFPLHQKIRRLHRGRVVRENVRCFV